MHIRKFLEIYGSYQLQRTQQYDLVTQKGTKSLDHIDADVLIITNVLIKLLTKRLKSF